MTRDEKHILRELLVGRRGAATYKSDRTMKRLLKKDYAKVKRSLKRDCYYITTEGSKIAIRELEKEHNRKVKHQIKTFIDAHGYIT